MREDGCGFEPASHILKVLKICHNTWVLWAGMIIGAFAFFLLFLDILNLYFVMFFAECFLVLGKGFAKYPTKNTLQRPLHRYFIY